MDPITVIVGALAAGAIAAVQDTASQVIKDAYMALKNAIIKKVKRSDDVDNLEKEPESAGRKLIVSEALTKADAANDQEMLALAKTLAEALNKAGLGSTTTNTISNNSGIAVQGNVTGNITQTNNYNTAPELSSIPIDGRGLVALLNQYFSLSEIDGLCFDLGIDDENLLGQTKDEKARSLVKYLADRGRIDALQRLMREARPNLRAQLS